MLLVSLHMSASIIHNKGFYSEQPATNWTEAIVTGNGTMGAMVEGNPYQENIIVNHAQLFLPVHPTLMPPSQGKHLSEIRQMMLDGKYREASKFVVDLANSEGYNVKHATDPFVPAFSIKIDSQPLKTSDYRRSVNFESGEASVEWKDDNGHFVRRTFVSRPDNVIVIHLTAIEGKLNTSLSLERVTTSDTVRRRKFRINEHDNFRTVTYGSHGRTLSFRAQFEKPQQLDDFVGFKGYEGVMSIVSCDGKVTSTARGLHIADATQALLLARVEMSSDFNADRTSHITKALEALPHDYTQLLQPHEEIHSTLFNRVCIDLKAPEGDRQLSSEKLLAKGGRDVAVIERLFNAARYNVISATGTHTPNLQGIWGGTITPNWSSDFTTNGNLPVAISHYLQANTPELMLPLLNMLDRYMDDFRTNARVLFNCRGIHIPSHFTMNGLDNHFDATWPMTFWVAGAPWYALFYYDYFLYTQDREFLRNRALPFMEEAIVFFEDFLQEDATGTYYINPSYSPENHPLNNKSQACINATMDVMAVNGLLHAVIEASETLGVNKEKVKHWRAMQQKMPQYQLNADGELREWMWQDLQDNHQHRHASHLYGLYDRHDPLITNYPDIIEGCRRVIDQRMQFRRKENTGVMAFGICQLAFSAAALGYADRCEEMLGWLGSNYWQRNLFSTHDPKKIFNCDISGGYPSLVMKMLVYSEPGIISLLPATPASWSKGSISGVALRGGIIMDHLSWNNSKVTVTLTSAKKQTVKILLRNKQVKKIHLKPGKKTVVSF